VVQVETLLVVLYAHKATVNLWSQSHFEFVTILRKMRTKVWFTISVRSLVWGGMEWSSDG
jgi:hypothetical protein